ncbi:tRNA (adenosine(37)-N6)-threonylcarbamoyltransferase complex dimerization subunit type 1 TsaB [Synechococcus sp. PCC 7336]|uniref:tRNA (adenosine(37)-N6)-threonylcarbamoyltransferase complex dimerization subunit type 1 TsaB n=1 Tax=Synechococcus sp. PCC 7336 TaxID=195250 RepID=UPI000374B809|nr:tRNA (adenosine(37)-N6)-threonylcarbamoyltransferase complex dimerization subunit type 1 TsaB [Synechococcus sp. PCC 7336]
MAHLILSLHTTTPTLGLALLSYPDRQPLRSQFWSLDRQMASQLHPCLTAFMADCPWPELLAVAVAAGPGSFTGCRMGVTVARTLGQALSIPVFGISTLAAIAAAVLSDGGEDRALAVQMDAKRGEWFGGIYEQVEGDLQVASGDRLYSPEDWAIACKGLTAVDAADWSERPPAMAVAAIAARHYDLGERPDWSQAVPQYRRTPPIHRG